MWISDRVCCNLCLSKNGKEKKIEKKNEKVKKTYLIKVFYGRGYAVMGLHEIMDINRLKTPTTILKKVDMIVWWAFKSFWASFSYLEDLIFISDVQDIIIWLLLVYG